MVARTRHSPFASDHVNAASRQWRTQHQHRYHSTQQEGFQPVTTPTIELMHRHGSVRQFTAEPVPRALVETIVQAAQRASTSSNLQMFSAVAVTDTETRNRLSVLCGGQEQIRQAPVFIAWCADLSRLDRAATLRGHHHEAGYVENFVLCSVDTGIAMQNGMLAAESMGLGACYIGAIRNQSAEVIELLRLPRYVFPVAGMTLGWPAQTPPIRPRLPLDAVLHWEHFSNEGLDPLLEEYDQAMIATGIYEDRQVSSGEAHPAQPAAAYGWTEHSARRVARPLRTSLKSVLAQQGFELK